MPPTPPKKKEGQKLSRLLKVMRAKDDSMFVLRVQGAAVQVALQRFQENAPEPEMGFAVSVLENPASISVYIPTLLAGVTQITDQIQINGNAIDTAEVTDDVLIAGVRIFFSLAAKRWGDVNGYKAPASVEPTPTEPTATEPTTGTDTGTTTP